MIIHNFDRQHLCFAKYKVWFLITIQMRIMENYCMQYHKKSEYFQSPGIAKNTDKLGAVS